MNFEEIVGPAETTTGNFVEMTARLVQRMNPDATIRVEQSADGAIILQQEEGATWVIIPRFGGEPITASERTAIEAVIDGAINAVHAAGCRIFGTRDLSESELIWFNELQERVAPIPVMYIDDVALASYLEEHEAIRQEFFPAVSVGSIVLVGGMSIDGSPVEQLRQAVAEAVAADLEGPAPEEILLAIAEKMKGLTRLKVLVFGPGPGGGDIYRKRCEVRDRLRRLGHTAHFGEEICKTDALKASGLNVSVGEYIAACGYDYIVILMTSPGSIGEAHDFARNRRLANKMMICVDQQHRVGYSAQGIVRQFEGLNGKMDWFDNPRDIVECHLSTRVLEQVQKLAEHKQWEVANAGEII